MEQKPLSAGEQKIQEYVKRIEDGEPEESITQGLPASFVSGIKDGLEAAKEVREQKEKKEIAKIKNELGIVSNENQAEQAERYPLVADLVEQACQGKKQAVVDLYKNLFDHINESESRKKIIASLFQSVYNKYRIAEYPTDLNEEQVWNKYLASTNVGVNNKKPEWMYRGVFQGRGIEAVTRGSFNVNVTPELIDALDGLITSGKIKANYKFGQPGTPASPTERHDSISIYFLEQPSEQALQELAAVISPYVRGDNLLGKKVSDGFFMSEIGSVESEHIETFVERFKVKDIAFAEAVKEYTSPQPGRGNSLKMSEAQFYAIKDVAKAFGYNISYNKDAGFELV